MRQQPELLRLASSEGDLLLRIALGPPGYTLEMGFEALATEDLVRVPPCAVKYVVHARPRTEPREWHLSRGRFRELGVHDQLHDYLGTVSRVQEGRVPGQHR